MSQRWRWAILGGGFGMYLIGLGFLGTIVAGRIRFDHQELAILDRYSGALKSYLQRQENSAAEATEDSWVSHVRRVEEALARQDFPAAEAAWRQAYVAALRSQRWEELIEAGDLCLEIGEAGGNPRAAEPPARRAYLQAVMRARAQGSVDGLLRAAEAFARLGDTEATKQSLRMAESVAVSKAKN